MKSLCTHGAHEMEIIHSRVKMHLLKVKTEFLLHSQSGKVGFIGFDCLIMTIETPLIVLELLRIPQQI